MQGAHFTHYQIPLLREDSNSSKNTQEAHNIVIMP